MSNSENYNDLVKVRYSNFQTKMIIRVILSFFLFGMALFSLDKAMLKGVNFLNVLLFVFPVALVWITADTILINLLRRRYQQPIFILMYKPYLSENKKRSVIKELAILSWIIGHLLVTLLGLMVEFYTALFIIVGLFGVGNSISLYFSAKFDIEE